MPPGPDPTFEQQLVAHRDYLLKFARLQLRNESWAEDAVSETIVAALSKPQAFGNRSQLKTWLVGILKHKVIDIFRLHARTVALETDPHAGHANDELDALVFKANGHFAQPPANWGNPEQDLQSQQFFAVLEACTEKMPPAMGRARPSWAFRICTASSTDAGSATSNWRSRSIGRIRARWRAQGQG